MCHRKTDTLCKRNPDPLDTTFEYLSHRLTDRYISVFCGERSNFYYVFRACCACSVRGFYICCRRILSGSSNKTNVGAWIFCGAAFYWLFWLHVCTPLFGIPGRVFPFLFPFPCSTFRFSRTSVTWKSGMVFENRVLFCFFMEIFSCAQRIQCTEKGWLL